MKIEVLGSGCSTCKKLHEMVNKIVKEEKLNAEVEYSDDVSKILEMGLIHSPVLAIDGKPAKLSSLDEKNVRNAILGKNEKGGCGNCSCGGNC